MKLNIKLISIYTLFFLCFLLPCKSSNAQVTDSVLKQGSINIKSATFHYLEILTNDSGENYIELKLFMKDKEILSQTLYYSVGDAEDYQMELGDFEVKDSLFYLYNYWCFYGSCWNLKYGMPYGAQIQIFKLDKNKNLVCSSSKIFMEMCSYYIADMTARERKKYIRQIEKEYNAQFVLGEEAKQLIQEVKTKLQKKIAEETKGWETMERPFRR